MRAYLAHLRAEFSGPRPFVIWAGLTGVFSFGGPLGTLESLHFENRFLLWAGVCSGMIALTAVIGAGLLRHPSGMIRRVERVLTAGVVALAVLVPIRVFAEGGTGGSLPIVSARLPETTGFLFLTALLLVTLRQVSPPVMSAPALAPVAPAEAEPSEGPIAEAEAAPQAVLPRVVARLEPPLQGRLLSLTGRDHYVDVRTCAGTGSILMRFSDAMAEVAPIEGARIHRSHWVAWDAIEGVEKDGNKLFLRVAGQRLPVSRSYREALVARGLL